MKKYKILAIMGKAGSGKDTLLKALLREPVFADAAPIISCTTRPIRENEQDGVDYHFLKKEDFTIKLLSGDMLEATVFNDWCYGTALSSLSEDKVNIGVFNPEGIEILQQNDNIDLTVIYIQADDKDRLLRQLMRENNPDVHEIVRRFSTDEKDFDGARIETISPNYIIWNNDGKSITKLAAAIAAAWTNLEK